MAPTTRDRVWAAVLVLGIEYRDQEGPNWFTLEDVMIEADLDESKRRTAKRTLDAMAELTWVGHTRGSSKYRLTPPGGRMLTTSHYWANDRHKQRQLIKMARSCGYEDGMFPLRWFLDAVEDHIKDEAVAQWRAEIEEMEAEPS